LTKIKQPNYQSYSRSSQF